MLIYTHTLRLCIRNTVSSYVFMYVYTYIRALNVHVFTHVYVTQLYHSLSLSLYLHPPPILRAIVRTSG